MTVVAQTRAATPAHLESDHAGPGHRRRHPHHDDRTGDDRSDDHGGRHGSDDGPGHDRFDDNGGDR